MKLNNHPYRTIVLLLLVLLAAACTREDDFATLPDEGTASAAPITITVTDGAYAPAQSPDDDNSPDTRAVERGYATEFTAGDKIGLYVLYVDSLNRRLLLRENLCVTYNGTEWTLDSGEEPLPPQPNHRFNKNVYFAYYPYQPLEDPRSIIDQNATNSENVKTTEARFFFKPLIKDWKIPANLLNYKGYTAADLMVAGGEVAKHTDGTDGYELSFTMEHQMVLAVIRVPTTKYIYTETIGGVETEEKSYRLYNRMLSFGWKPNNYTDHYLVNPNATSWYLLNHYYYNSSLKKCTFQLNTQSLEGKPGGTYHLFTIDGGEETVENRPLHEGDFYMKDGTILPHDAFPGGMPADVQEDCLGVVFWAGENEGRHWTKTGDVKGDHLLMRDHPGCVHGMVVALRDASAGDVWATGSGASEWLYEWAENFDGFTPGEQADWSAIQKSSVVGYGYCSSHLVKLYSAHHPDAAFPAYNKIGSYAALHPAPGSSSGWFFPGQNELGMMCYGKAGNFGQYVNTERRDFLNGQFQKAGGTAFEGWYWSSIDAENRAWSLDFNGATDYRPKLKSDNHKVRAILAF